MAGQLDVNATFTCSLALKRSSSMSAAATFESEHCTFESWSLLRTQPTTVYVRDHQDQQRQAGC